MFVKMRRLEKRAAANSQHLPPLSPCAKVKPHHLISSSGEPCTHPGLLEGASEERVDVEFIDHYECAGGVNVGILLRATRSSLVERVEDLGANALVEEQYVFFFFSVIDVNSSFSDGNAPSAVRRMGFSESKSASFISRCPCAA